MSYDPIDAEYERGMDELYREFSKEALADFTLERLQSFYIENPTIAKAPSRSLNEAKQLFSLKHFDAALVFAVAATEVGIKVALLKPIVYGLVHNESVAAFVAELAISHTGFDRFQKLLFEILREYGGIDLQTFKRPDAKKSLWEESTLIQNRRNTIVHRAETASEEEASQSIAIASTILTDIFPQVITKLKLHLHDDFRVCNDRLCSFDDEFRELLLRIREKDRKRVKQ